MRRVLALLLTTSALLGARGARAGELGSNGRLVADARAVLSISFDDASDLIAAGASRTWWYQPNPSSEPWRWSLRRDAIVDEAPFRFGSVPTATALEGRGALAMGATIGDGATGIELPAAAITAALVSDRFELRIWGRANGVLPHVYASYAPSSFGPDDNFTRVVAIPTGRETSDGWLELSTGPIDRTVVGHPLRRVLIAADAGSPHDATFAIDALEVVPAVGVALAPTSCTQADVETTCGSEGECQFGLCVPGYAVWGALPPEAHRSALVDRWITFETKLEGDRTVTSNAATPLVSRWPTEALYATASRPFLGGLRRTVNALRNQHMNFGEAWGADQLSPIAWDSNASALGACFGVGMHDLLDGARGFIVFSATKSPATGTPLQVGDALTKIDGMAPIDWVRAVWPSYAPSLPCDPDADWGWSAANLSALITRRASTVELTRCASPTACDASHRTVLTIDVATLMRDRIRTLGTQGDFPGDFGCGPRFHPALTKLAPPVPGEDTVSAALVGDVMTVQFDGMSGTTHWGPSFQAAFASAPKKALIDTRQGNGGHVINAGAAAGSFRGPDSPIGFLALPSFGGADAPTMPSALTLSKPCIDAPSSAVACLYSQTWFDLSATPAGASSRIALLTTADISTNDFFTRLAQGRPSLRIFGSNATSGAFGSISQVPSSMIGWYGGTLQMLDTRWSASFDALSTARWESSHGVPADTLVAETMSDAMQDRDTMLAAALAWLAGSGP